MAITNKLTYCLTFKVTLGNHVCVDIVPITNEPRASAFPIALKQIVIRRDGLRWAKRAV